MPPSVLPAVATKTALQNMSGLSLSRPNSAGSEPSGSSVAETKAATKSVRQPELRQRQQRQEGFEPGLHAARSIRQSSRREPVGAYAVAPISIAEIAAGLQSCLIFQQPPSSHPMNIGPHILANNLFVAPMAGVTDRPFRQLCRQLGAGYAVSEMVTSRRELWNS